LIPLLSEDLREVVSREAFEAVKESNAPSKSALIASLVPFLSESLLQEALEIITAPSPLLSSDFLLLRDQPHLNKLEEGRRRDIARNQPLRDLAPYLKQPQLQHVLLIARSLRDEQFRANLLAGIAPYLSSSLLQGALEITQDIEDHTTRGVTAAYLVSHLPEEQQKQALPSLQTVNYRFLPELQRSLHSQLPDERCGHGRL
jgi:hypothetical protein